MPSLRPLARPMVAMLASAWLLAGCQAPAPLPYTQQFDEHTGATVTTVASPIVYYADAPDLAVNARDYVSVWAFEVKENAVRRLYLACELWSTIDRTRVPGIAPLPQPKQVNLRVDDIAVPLRVAGDDLQKIGLGRWPFPDSWSPGIDAVVDWGGGRVYFFKRDQFMRYEIGPEGLKFVAQSLTDRAPAARRIRRGAVVRIVETKANQPLGANFTLFADQVSMSAEEPKAEGDKGKGKATNQRARQARAGGAKP